MVTQGLNPAKKQCYFIAYGKSLNLQRSYFGDLAVMKRLNNVKSVNSNVVYEKDDFSINIELDGSKSIVHKTSFESLGSPIKGAYCIINFQDGTRHIEVMSIEQVHRSWKQSKSYVFEKNGSIKPESVHGKFPEEMTKRTVIRKACKLYINTSDDNDLIIESFNRTTDSEYKSVEHEVEKEIEDNANTEVIDIEPTQEEIEPVQEDVEISKEEEEITPENYDEVPY
jgi:recombination protein RecT